ncbi:MAG: outer membrane protein assembly factor BamD, partial [Kiritimatiellae bacterium]|nr:outer membrane protein assembly factor BamD [Kiritimatiellia bacterium]
LKAGDETAREARRAGSFNGTLYLAIGSIDNADESVLKAVNSSQREQGGQAPGILAVNGSDVVRLRVKDGEEVLAERTVSFVSNGSLALLDSSWSAERDAVHAGERFFVQVNDADRDLTDDADRITVDVKSLLTGRARKVVLTETIPHSGIFNGTLRPILFPKSEEIPLSVTGAVSSVDELVAEDRFAASFGDRLVFSYHDELVLPGSEPRTLCATGLVHRGSDGSVRLFSKRFRDSDQAVLVQFRLAECLFEQAKEHRKLKQPEKSADAIAKGRFILEEALKNYPDSSHVVQGEFLLANLFQELATEARDAKDAERARQLYTEALSRFSTIVAVWPEGEYAARAQYHKALCLEMLEDYRRAAEEYVKMTYLYPESELVGDATIRLATHYYTREKRYDVSARIYENFQRRFPQHEKAARALFMCGSCYIKQAEELQRKAEEKSGDKSAQALKTVKGACEMYVKAAEAFDRLGEVYRDTTTPELRAQAMYWSGDVQLRAGNAKGAYRTLKRCVLEYPETEWARRARGLLLQESDSFRNIDE